MERRCGVIENLAVAQAHANSRHIVYEPFVAGAFFVPAGVVGNVLWWGAGQNTPAGASPTGMGSTSTYPTNAQTGLSPNFAPIINAQGQQVSQNVTGGALGQWYAIPAECRPFAMLKITSSTVTNVSVVLKS